MKIAVVEDKSDDAQALKELIDRYGVENGVVFDTDCFTDGMAFLDAFRCQYDIVFLDIEMPLLDGRKTAVRLRERDKTVGLIFVTCVDSFAVEGYTVDAAAYLLKPASYYTVGRALKKAIVAVERGKPRKITVKTQSGVTALASDDIYYVEVYNHDLKYHTVNGEIVCHEPLGEVEKKLGSGFCRCNNSFSVNLKNVSAVIGDEVVTPKGRLHISRGKKQFFLNEFMRYVTGGDE